jgi:hypothetical protein
VPEVNCCCGLCSSPLLALILLLLITAVDTNSVEQSGYTWAVRKYRTVGWLLCWCQYCCRWLAMLLLTLLLLVADAAVGLVTAV